MWILQLRRYTHLNWLLMGLLLLGLVWLCRPQRTVTAQAPEQSFFAPETWAYEFASAQGYSPEHPRLLADVNGDKRQDVIGFGNDGVRLGISTGTGFSTFLALAEFGYNQGWRAVKHVRAAGDINGDGMEDIVGFGDAGVYRALSTGTGFGATTFVAAGFGYDQGWRVDKHVRLLADVNGDGKKDIVGFGDDGVYLSLATSNGFFSNATFVVAGFCFNQGWRNDKHVRTTADVNGDGRQDIVGFGDYGVWTALSTGDGFATPQFALDGFAYYSGSWRVEKHPRLMADINNDGREDIVGFGDDGVWIARSTWSGFNTPEFAIQGFGYNQGWRVGKEPIFENGQWHTGCSYSTCGSGVHPRFVADLNGDGYQDIVGFGDDSVYRVLGGPNGFGAGRDNLRALVVHQGFPWNSYEDVVPRWYPRLVGDVNGDGKQDLVAFDHDDIKVVRSSDLPPAPFPAPGNLRITGNTTTSISIAWDDNSDNERIFIIKYYKIGDSPQYTTRSANTTQAVISSLSSDTQYCFAVYAENVFGFSAESLTKCGRTSPQPTPTPTPTPTPGYSGVNVFNCNSDEHTVYIWTRDVTNSSWEQRDEAPSLWNGGSCPGSMMPVNVPLQDGHSFWWVVVDPEMFGCGGQNDPTNPFCQRQYFTQPLRGNANGHFLRLLVN